MCATAESESDIDDSEREGIGFRRRRVVAIGRGDARGREGDSTAGATCKPLPGAVSSPQAPRRKPLPGAIHGDLLRG